MFEHLNISQGRRWYFYSWRDQPPIPVQEIVQSSANMHLIPANAAMECARCARCAGASSFTLARAVGEGYAPEWLALDKFAFTHGFGGRFVRADVRGGGAGGVSYTLPSSEKVPFLELIGLMRPKTSWRRETSVLQKSCRKAAVAGRRFYRPDALFSIRPVKGFAWTGRFFLVHGLDPGCVVRDCWPPPWWS